MSFCSGIQYIIQNITYIMYIRNTKSTKQIVRARRHLKCFKAAFANSTTQTRPLVTRRQLSITQFFQPSLLIRKTIRSPPRTSSCHVRRGLQKKVYGRIEARSDMCPYVFFQYRLSIIIFLRSRFIKSMSHKSKRLAFWPRGPFSV